MRPSRLAWTARLRSNLLHAPAFLFGTVFFGSLAMLASVMEGRPPQTSRSEASSNSLQPDPAGDRSPHGVVQHRLARRWARASIRAAGVRLEVLGAENIPMGKNRAAACVYAANHTSYMDTPVIFAGLPFQFRILAKKELWPIPFIGWYLDRSGQIPIDTENPRATVSSLGAGVRTLRQGLSVFVFPEGGRTPTGELQTFMNGAAYLAIRAQAPLVPVALIGVYDLLPIHTRHFFHNRNRTPLKLVFGKPIDTAGMSLRQADSLTSQLRQMIADLIEQHT